MGRKIKKTEEVDSVESYILRLNVITPLDRWWRQRHNIAFNSPEHRQVSLVEQYAEWYEDKIYKEALERAKKRKSEPYIIGDKDFLYEKEKPQASDTMSEDEFDSINLDNL